MNKTLTPIREARDVGRPFSWQPMSVRLVGTVAELVLQGGGKLSTAGGDTGDPRKQKGGAG